MKLASTLIASPSALKSRVPHPDTNVLEALAAGQHQIRKAFSAGVECDARTEVSDHRQPNRPLERSRSQNAQCESLLIEENWDRLPSVFGRRGNNLRLIDLQYLASGREVLQTPKNLPMESVHFLRAQPEPNKQIEPIKIRLIQSTLAGALQVLRGNRFGRSRNALLLVVRFHDPLPLVATRYRNREKRARKLPRDEEAPEIGELQHCAQIAKAHLLGVEIIVNLIRVTKPFGWLDADRDDHSLCGAPGDVSARVLPEALFRLVISLTNEPKLELGDELGG